MMMLNTYYVYANMQFFSQVHTWFLEVYFCAAVYMTVSCVCVRPCMSLLLTKNTVYLLYIINNTERFSFKSAWLCCMDV